jgi:hypothetical protein
MEPQPLYIHWNLTALLAKAVRFKATSYTNSAEKEFNICIHKATYDHHIIIILDTKPYPIRVHDV